jgi:uncharacterized ion transporter superfamily protein YfcC
MKRKKRKRRKKKEKEEEEKKEKKEEEEEKEAKFIVEKNLIRVLFGLESTFVGIIYVKE